jgi:hypothetical protein
MENLKITVTITEGNKTVTASTDLESYENMKQYYGMSQVEEITLMLLEEIKLK